MVYVQGKDWNGKEPPHHVYSEMHTAGWRCETHVGSDSTFHATSLQYIRIKN